MGIMVVYLLPTQKVFRLNILFGEREKTRANFSRLCFLSSLGVYTYSMVKYLFSVANFVRVYIEFFLSSISLFWWQQVAKLQNQLQQWFQQRWTLHEIFTIVRICFHVSMWFFSKIMGVLCVVVKVHHMILYFFIMVLVTMIFRRYAKNRTIWCSKRFLSEPNSLHSLFICKLTKNWIQIDWISPFSSNIRITEKISSPFLYFCDEY